MRLLDVAKPCVHTTAPPPFLDGNLELGELPEDCLGGAEELLGIPMRGGDFLPAKRPRRHRLRGLAHEATDQIIPDCRSSRVQRNRVRQDSAEVYTTTSQARSASPPICSAMT